MARRIREDETGQGQDSFLDVVANIVGILIILVMVVGVRVKNTPAVAATVDSKTQTAIDALEGDLATETSLHGDVLQAADRAKSVAEEAVVRFGQRTELANAVSMWEHKIKERKNRMGDETRRNFDVECRVAQSLNELKRLEFELNQTKKAQTAPIVVESLPTPLSKTVDADEAFFQIRGGRIAYIPLEDLLRRFKHDAHRKVNQLRSVPELVDTVGPIRGFRLRYRLERFDVPLDTQRVRGVTGSVIRLTRWTLVPTRSQLGETIDEALSAGSEFRRALSKYRVGRSTITIWTYEDSFADFRRIKKELHQLGFATAGRPLPFGESISGTPWGTKSAAQ